ncbi:MAG: hypothetical protein AVDCRST_MAG66-4003 [uncultured Pseudonocardia sp.]|uniref:Uncharacterized protein n=1 Tax=uncultured Pseudonocardia sp. TaxID=211455 RepID=A0A6J4QM72_9PSEU|nr:MAG: hypothetical protein AVDCRST_MAG66-4003 [uncultured Pseudonocardia sp.]
MGIEFTTRIVDARGREVAGLKMSKSRAWDGVRVQAPSAPQLEPFDDPGRGVTFLGLDDPVVDRTTQDGRTHTSRAVAVFRGQTGCDGRVGEDPESQRRSDHEQDEHGDGEAEDVGTHGAEQRRDAADGQAAEPVGHPLRQVDRDVRPGGHQSGEGSARDEDAREEVLQVLLGRAGDRTAEEVEEHDHEQGRRDDAVHDRSGVAGRLRQAATGEDDAVPQPAERPGPVRAGVCGRGGHDALRSGVEDGLPGAPVRVRNTSSRLGSRK